MTATIDRSSWPIGPWDSEPDREEWREGDVRCLLSRSHATGAWHGYAIVDPEHPWARLHWHALGTDVAEWGSVAPDGSTWFGFDCGHYGQATPMNPDYFHYVTMWEARRDVTALAAILSRPPPPDAMDVTIARLRREVSYYTGDGEFSTYQRGVLIRWLGLLGEAP